MTTGGFAGGNLCDLRCGPGEGRIEHDGRETSEFLCLQRLTRQVALCRFDAAGKTGVIGGDAQCGCGRCVALPCCDTATLRQREGDGAAAGEQFRDASLGREAHRERPR